MGRLVPHPNPCSGAALTPTDLPVPSEKHKLPFDPKSTWGGSHEELALQKTGWGFRLLLSCLGTHNPLSSLQQKVQVGHTADIKWTAMRDRGICLV